MLLNHAFTVENKQRKPKPPNSNPAVSTSGTPSPSFSDTYPVEHISPALHGDALKHREHGKSKIVKVGDAVLRSLPARLALGAVLTLPPVRRLGRARRRVVFCRCILKEREREGGKRQLKETIWHAGKRVKGYQIFLAGFCSEFDGFLRNAQATARWRASLSFPPQKKNHNGQAVKFYRQN